MSEILYINEFDSNQGKIDRLTSGNADIDTLDSQNAVINALTADMIRLKNQIEILSNELTIVKDSSELIKISSGKTEIRNNLFVKNELVSLPVGTVVAFAGKNIPDGWLVCDGRSTNDHPKLKQIIGDHVPDLTNRFVMGLSVKDNSNLEWKNKYAGNSSIQLREDNLPPHDHLYTTRIFRFSINYGNASDGFSGNGASKIHSTSAEENTFSSYTMGNENLKSSPIDITPTHFKLLYIIKAE